MPPWANSGAMSAIHVDLLAGSRVFAMASAKSDFGTEADSTACSLLWRRRVSQHRKGWKTEVHRSCVHVAGEWVLLLGEEHRIW